MSSHVITSRALDAMIGTSCDSREIRSGDKEPELTAHPEPRKSFLSPRLLMFVTGTVISRSDEDEDGIRGDSSSSPAHLMSCTR